MKDIYSEIEKQFKTREMCGYVHTSRHKNVFEFKTYFYDLFHKHKNDVMIQRDETETYFYDMLENQLFHNLVEMKFYSDVNVLNSRRLTSQSKDCISDIHILIRDDIIFNVYFRSSDFDGALLCDLKFLSTLPAKFIDHLEANKNDKNYKEIDSSIIKELKNKNVVFNTFFGSLHKTK